jgi:hypothetical protein
VRRVLVCALDWGLGHATRSVPVVQALLRQGADVVLASSGDAGQLLKMEFPDLPYHELPGYRPHYPRNGSMIFSMAGQLLKFRHAIHDEHARVETLVDDLGITAVISDNRYGCYSRKVPSVFITHQLNVRLSPGWRLLERLINGWQRLYNNKYREVWVPDLPDSGLTGHFQSNQVPFHFIGWLSRFGESAPSVEKYDLVALVSGPEPQRTLFAQSLRRQLQSFQGKSLLVLGVPGEANPVREGKVEIVNHLPAKELEARLVAAELVIARSGYSTIMDLIVLGKKAAFVPTPGQPEQIHLAHFLQRSSIAFCQDQENFAIEAMRRESANFKGLGVLVNDGRLLEKAITRLLS